MAKRKFELPGIHELSKEQERAVRLPLDGCHLVIGGPGTGKTVVVLLRLRRFAHQASGTKSLFLVYNRLLHEASRQLCGESMESATWMKWFMALFHRRMNQPVPRRQEESGHSGIDWNALISVLIEAQQGGAAWAVDPDGNEAAHLFIDEGQDMPPTFYSALIRMGFEHFYVVADQNQAITPENASRKQLENVLAVEPEAVVELRQNYRNTHPVARLASAFYPHDPATPAPDLPACASSDMPPVLVEYGHGCRWDFSTLAARILKLADRDPQKLIGVIVPNNDVRKRYYDALKDLAASGSIRLDLGAPRIETYAYGLPSELRFDAGGIFVINARSCKGLEFDTVLIGDIHAFPCHANMEDEMRRLFYVMVARAKERVFLIRKAGTHCPVNRILPDDCTILTHWSGAHAK